MPSSCRPSGTARAQRGGAPSDKARTVLRAARSVFLKHGFSAATTDMIQQKACVSKSTIYAYYSNKEALFAAVIEAECAAFTSTLHDMEFHQGQLREMLIELARSYMDIVLCPTGLDFYRVVIAESRRFPKLAQIFYSAGPKVMTALLAKQLTSAEAAGELEFGEITPYTAASQFINLIRSDPQMQYLIDANTKPVPAEVDQWLNAAVTLFMRAYGRRKEAA